MSIAKFSIGDAAISQSDTPTVRTKTPPKRQYVALADIKAVPEPR